MGSRDQTQITGLGGKHLYLLSHLSGPQTELTLFTYLIYLGVLVIFNDGMQDRWIHSVPLFLLVASKVKTEGRCSVWWMLMGQGLHSSFSLPLLLLLGCVVQDSLLFGGCMNYEVPHAVARANSHTWK